MNDQQKLKKYVMMFLSNPTDEQRAEIRDFFDKQAAAEKKFGEMQPTEVLRSPSPPPKIDQRERSENFYQSFMEKEFAKFNLNASSAGDCEPDTVAPNSSDKMDFENIPTKINWKQFRILDYKDRILSSIRSNKINILKGITGSGKSTQVPQYIMDDCRNRGEPFNIVITQPRRVAAKMLAARVSEELNVPLGGLVGYQIGLDKTRCSVSTRILYCTTGVLLQRFITTSYASNHTHIIIDEVHERSADVDMLLLILKRMILNNKLKSRIILMSATFDVKLLQNYFTIQKTQFILVPTLTDINISTASSGTLEYSREFFYLDDILEKIQLRLPFVFSIRKPNDRRRYRDYEDFLNNITDTNIVFDEEWPVLHGILCELVIDILLHFVEMPQNVNQTKGTVLIFLPGLAEIMNMMNLLKSVQSRYNWEIFILHSTVSLKDQMEVMRTSVSGSRHIILATNIAESSLTVPNVEFVIDFCLCKTMMTCHHGYSMSYLSLEWSSKSSCDQRAGRTGRTTSGQVYRLLPYNFYQMLLDYDIPEFEKIPLDNYVLKAKLIDPDLPPKMVLAYALSPPQLEDIDNSILSLKRAGAFTVEVERKGEGKVEYVYDPEDGTLTSLGYLMAMLPLDIKLSKLVALGLVFDVLNEAIVIASSHCVSGVFMKNHYSPIYTYKATLAWANNSFSDSLAYLKAYKMFKVLESSFFDNTFAEKWCTRNNIEFHRLLELETLISEISARLKYNLKINLNPKRNVEYQKTEQELILKVVLAGAFYPNYFVQQHANSKELGRYGTMKANTIFLNGFSRDSLTTSLYIPVLRKRFQECSSRIDFQVDGSMVFMTFDSNNYEHSINDEDHTLYQAYNLHINSSRMSKFNSSAINSFFKRTNNVPTSVYVALAYRKLVRGPIQVNKFTPNIEMYFREQLIKKIQSNAEIIVDQSDKLRLMDKNDSFTVNICHLERQYTLPKMCHVKDACSYIVVQVINFISADMFFAIYYHSYSKDMFHNLNLLTWHLRETCLNFDPKKDDLSSGEMIIAPLDVQSLKSIPYFLQHHNVDVHGYLGRTCILARAEVLKVTYNESFPMIYLNYIDFGFKDKLTSFEKIFKLNCRFQFGITNVIRTVIKEELLKLSTQSVHDMLFSIPPLAVKCDLCRIRMLDSFSVSKMQNFITDYLKDNQFILNAKVYSFVNDSLSIDLFAITKDSPSKHLVPFGSSQDVSLNEILVMKNFAEFKCESGIRVHHSQLREMKREDKAEFELVFENDLSKLSEYQLNLNKLNLDEIHNMMDLNSLPTERPTNVYTLNNFKIRGPTSPYEYKFMGLTSANQAKNVTISKNSVNIIALDTDPSEKYSKLLISGELFFNEAAANSISLTNTTMMPSLMDLPAFMALLFAPSVEFRVNKIVSDNCFSLGEEVCGAICGIGFDLKTSQSYDKDNDIDLFFDSSINMDDLSLLNLLRYQMSQFFLVKGEHIQKNQDGQSILDLEHDLIRKQSKCRQILLKLLFRNRIKRRWYSEQYVSVSPNFQWGLLKNACSYGRDRPFSFREFADDFLQTINLKAAVFPPFLIPILDQSTIRWEDNVMQNIICIENEDYEGCFDQKHNVFICKLCMFFSFTLVNFQSHVFSPVDNQHREAVFIFKKYYHVEMKNVDQMGQFAAEMKKEETTHFFEDDDNDDDLDDSSFNFNSITRQYKILQELNKTEEMNQNKQVATTSSEPPPRPGFGINRYSNVYTLDSLKEKIKTLTENGNLDIHELDKSAITDGIVTKLIDYFDEDELLLMHSLQIIPDFTHA